VHEPPRILVVDDNPNNVDILKTRLESHGYEIVTAADGEAALIRAVEDAPDLILLDLMMPGVDGLEVCRRLKSNRNVPFTPIVIITAKSDAKDVIAGLGAGADEYLTKPVDHASLVARVASMLRIKALQDTVEAQRRQIATWNEALQQKVKAQVDELDRLGRLKGFFSPQLAEAIVSAGADEVLKPHRREITVVYLDLRGFTQFTDSAEPEEVMNMLSQYHALAGELVAVAKQCRERKRTMLRRSHYENTPLKPQRVYQEMNQAFGADTCYVTTIGLSQIAGALRSSLTLHSRHRAGAWCWM